MDNLVFAKGAPPGKEKFHSCTPGYPASLFCFVANGSVDSVTQEKVVHFGPESVAQFGLE
jgi:hypothetical protein